MTTTTTTTTTPTTTRTSTTSTTMWTMLRSWPSAQGWKNFASGQDSIWLWEEEEEKTDDPSPGGKTEFQPFGFSVANLINVNCCLAPCVRAWECVCAWMCVCVCVRECVCTYVHLCISISVCCCLYAWVKRYFYVSASVLVYVLVYFCPYCLCVCIVCVL